MQFGLTALTYAAQMRHADCVRLLLEAGVDKNAKDKVRCVSPVYFQARSFRTILIML